MFKINISFKILEEMLILNIKEIKINKVFKN